MTAGICTPVTQWDFPAALKHLWPGALSVSAHLYRSQW